ncbi:MAG: squalene/phytoene synthase family protein, partial [Gemmatimonadota bacterium]|nr:squalene/phytoene synthase family protein [Gemmatimonadota bacterium]
MTAHEAAQAIASRDRSSLYLTSSFFKDRRRYEAFCAHYALMRVVDDRIDALPSRTGLAARQRTAEHDVVAAWGEGIRSCYHGRPVSKRVAERCGFPRAALLFDALGASLRAFRPHPELWTDFFRAMHWDLDHDRFDSWKEFLTYAEGASVAPTTIYLELITSRQSGGLPQDFELFHCGRQLGTFAYLAHVVRDLSKDLRTGENGLVYVSREDMATHGVTEQLLFADAERGRASLGTRRLVCDLLGRAKGFLSEGRAS